MMQSEAANRFLIDPKSQAFVDAVDYALDNLVETGLSPDDVAGAKTLLCVDVPIERDHAGNILCVVQLADKRVVATWAHGFPPQVLGKSEVFAILREATELFEAISAALALLRDEPPAYSLSEADLALLERDDMPNRDGAEPETDYPFSDAGCAVLMRGGQVRWPGTLAEFLAWEEKTPGRWELIDGFVKGKL